MTTHRTETGRPRTVIVDGYNVIYRIPRFKVQLDRSLQAGREALLRYCSEWKTRKRDVDRFYVVFDGDSSVVGGEATASAPGVRAIYSKTGETADRRIRRMLDQAEGHERIVVVSDDNEVRDSARVHHMSSMSALDFARRNTPSSRQSPQHGDDDAALSPSEKRMITDELRSLWDV